MARDILSSFNFVGGAGITGLPAATAAGQPVEFAQMNALIEGLAWKDDVRVATTANVNVASMPASIDGVTLAANDRFLAKDQSAGAQNGVYVFNGAGSAATRAADMSASGEFNAAVVPVKEGTANGGTVWRQTVADPTVGTTAIAFTTLQTAAAAASETAAGIMEIATQTETDAGLDDARAVTSLKLANWSGRLRKTAATIGDGSATSIDVTHNFNTRDVMVAVTKNSGNYDDVECEVQRPTVNKVTLVFASAPANNALRAVVMA